MRRRFLTAVVATLAYCVIAPSVAAGQDSCPISYGGADDAKPRKVYLYFPAANDKGFPEFGLTFKTSPARRFDVADLPSYTGTAAKLRNAITAVVAATYCEFNVQVLQTATPPPTTFAERNTVAVGSDAFGTCPQKKFGFSAITDTGDTMAVNFARVWAGTYEQCATGAGGALHGANSTLERWARSIGGTAAHEAGHGFGLAHTDGNRPLAPGEDARVHHIMAPGPTYSFDDRADFRRHFSDHEYSVLAANVGLSVQTTWSWDFVNPDAGTGVTLQMDVLSVQPSLILSSAYGGPKSPWINPTLSGPSGTTTFKGVTYKKYRLQWSTAHAWSGGMPGQIGGGMPFHVGVAFSSVNFSDPDPIIVTDVRLIDASNRELPLHPRNAAFDTGTREPADGVLTMRVFNFGDVLEVRKLRVDQLPRLASLDTMVAGTRPTDMTGLPLRPWREAPQPDVVGKVLEKNGELKVTLARLNQPPHVTQRVGATDCGLADSADGSDVGRCLPGVQNDLFPSTVVLVTAELVDSRARHWDPASRRFVVGPVTTTVSYQMAGRRRSDRPR